MTMTSVNKINTTGNFKAQSFATRIPKGAFLTYFIIKINFTIKLQIHLVAQCNLLIPTFVKMLKSKLWIVSLINVIAMWVAYIYKNTVSGKLKYWHLLEKYVFLELTFSLSTFYEMNNLLKPNFLTNTFLFW